MTTPKDVIDEMQSFLDSELTDPNPTRRSDEGRWIYTVPLKLNLAEYPRIHIQEVSSTHEGYSLGSNERTINTRIEVQIWVHKDSEFDVEGSEELEKAEDLLDYLGDKVVQKINDNQSRWKGLGDVHHLVSEEEQTPDTPNDDTIRRTVDFILRHHR